MSLFNPLLIVGVGTFMGASGAITFNVMRSRRAERIRLRREQLLSFARRSGLDFVGERPRAEDEDAANWYRGNEDAARADSFLQGQDRNGRYWMARREIAGQQQEVFGFQIRGDLRVGDVSIEPVMAEESGPPTLVERVLRRTTAPTSTNIAHWATFQRASGKEVLDENARRSIEQWTARLVNRSRSDARIPLGLEIHDGRGWVFSTRVLEGARMKEFLDLALELRGSVLQEVQRRPATISVPVNTITGEADLRNRASTQPLFAVQSAEGADLGEQSNTVLLSAADLLRDVPAPQKQKIRKFEIPEPEEEVEVIWSR